MNGTFNQNCQLIINDTPNKQDCDNVLEVLVKKSNGEFFAQGNRTEPGIQDIELDGLYELYVIPTNQGQSGINSELNKGGESFKSVKDSSGNSIFNSEVPENEIFSLCHLRKCTFVHERQAIEEFLSVCNKKNCNKKSSQQSTRDILLISVFVLEHLISKHRYSEAETILDSLSSCKNICGDSVTKTCCCNG